MYKIIGWVLLGLLLIWYLTCSSSESYTPPFASDDELEYQNLNDASLVRLTNKGPYQPKPSSTRKDCLHLMNPGALVDLCDAKPNVVLQTSSQWYLARPDQTQIILHPDGWLDLINPTQWWYNQLITVDEYQKRLAKSTLGHTTKDALKNTQPF